MGTLTTWALGLAAVSAVMVMTWTVSVVRRDASLVDRVWGLGFVVAAWVWALLGDGEPTRSWVVVALVTIWGLRLSAHITWRNWGHGEDPRYQQMRERHDAFAVRSLVTVFLLQAVLAGVIAVPLFAVATTATPFGWIDVVAIALWGVGFVFEAGADLQLARFRTDPTNRGRVLDTGLWRHSRHPNYFGDSVVWWAYGLFAVATGAWWALVGPVMMTLLIVKVSGVALTDRNMSASPREGHAEYVRRTNAFFPGPRRPA